MYELYIKQKVFKITDHYEVFDFAQNAVYYVDQEFELIGNTVHVRKADGQSSFVIRKELFTFLPQYTVDFSNGKSLIIKKNLSFLKTNIDILSDAYSLNLNGDFWGMNFAVYGPEGQIGNIKKEYLSWGDTYTLQIFQPHYEADLLAVLIVVDDIKDTKERRH